MKRLLDIVSSALGMVFLSPVIGAVALFVRLRLGKPVLFRQVRPGRHHEPFVMYKFRSMTNATDACGQLLPDADRITKLGVFLRKTSLDEIPELWNVLRGDMSLVGPRPLLPQYTEYMTPDEMRRYQVRPGITGWAQVNGRNTATWDERLSYDVWYVDNWSLKLDVGILRRTLRIVVRRDGVLTDPGAHMQNLDDERRSQRRHA